MKETQTSREMRYPRKSVGSVSSVVYASLPRRFFRTHRPPMTLIRRIFTDFLLAVWLEG